MEHDGTAGSGSLHGISRRFDSFGRTCNNGLARAVEIDSLDDAALGRNLGTDFFYLFFIEAEDSRHSSFSEGNGFLHELAAQPYCTDGIGKTQGAGRYEGRVFTKAVAGSDVRRQSFLLKDPAAGRAGREDGRLGVAGLHQFFIRTFENQLRQRKMQGIIGFFKQFFYDRIVVV